MEKTGGKFIVQWEKHSNHVFRGLCMLMERQCLVDIAICCGSNTLHAHKCVLAANSSYFKEQFENKGIEQVIINGINFAVLKALIEFMYCGECVLADDMLKNFIAAVRFFKISVLEAVFAENEYQSLSAEEICIPPPQFICKPPKYPTVYKPFANAPVPSKRINYTPTKMFGLPNYKYKYFGNEVEKACAKEAQASRLALANLRKAMASSPEVHSFIVEESCNETTVENFIPRENENYENMDVQLVNETSCQSDIDPKLKVISNEQDLTTNKIKNILGNDEVEIMFQTTDGNYIDVPDDVLLNLSKTGLQYQVIDENGKVSEIQELKELTRKTVISESLMEDNCRLNSVLPIHTDKISDSALLTDDAFQYQPQSFTEDVYMGSSEIYEPENLSMHSELLPNISSVFPKIRSLKDPAPESQSSMNQVDLVPKPFLKFNPDLFFAQRSPKPDDDNKTGSEQ